MKNQELVDLNFRRLIDYRGQPPVRREHPIECFGYCTFCEDKKIIDRGILGRMSHGCDTSDFEVLLGLFSGVKRFDERVMFLLEDPGGDQGLGGPFSYQGHSKAPPANCYYFAPEREALQHWPSNIDDFNFRKYYYGPYFAYLMRKHGLQDVYITNIVKCGVGHEHRQLKTEPVYNAVTRNCVERFLLEELRLVRLSVVFCFSHAAKRRFDQFLGSPSSWNVRYLTHPSFIRRRWKTHQALIKKNDETIRQALGELKSS